MNIPIIYEDNHLLVVEKVPNLPVQEDASGDQDMLTILKADLKERYNKPGNVYLGLVHRLDRPVGGRIRRLAIDGQDVDTIGIPCHWGYEGTTRKGFLANTLTPGVGDSNTHTPEYKAFLVNIEKA